MTYRVSPQCPDSGLPIDITYAFGRLSVSMDEKWLREVYGPEGGSTDEAGYQEALEATKAWAKGVHGRRCGSVEEAQSFLEDAGLNGDYLESDRW